MPKARMALSLAALCVCLTACGGKSSENAPAASEAVTVVTLKVEPVTLTRTLPGRTSAFLVAEVRPQVSGVIRRRLFTEGGTVRAGEVLFDLDDSLYRANLESARAALQRAEATAAAVTAVAESLSREGGQQAANLKVAEQYVNAFAYLAKTNNTLIVPANMGDMATLITSAMTMLERTKAAQAKPA